MKHRESFDTILFCVMRTTKNRGTKFFNLSAANVLDRQPIGRTEAKSVEIFRIFMYLRRRDASKRLTVIWAWSRALTGCKGRRDGGVIGHRPSGRCGPVLHRRECGRRRVTVGHCASVDDGHVKLIHR